MKRTLGVIVCMLLIFICTAAMADVKINETNFPDKNFRNFIGSFDTDGNGTLNDEEIKNIVNITCNDCSIKSLEGIGFFPNLVYLNCVNNQLTSLDLRNNKKLFIFHCSNNQLTSLNVEGNTILRDIGCSKVD